MTDDDTEYPTETTVTFGLEFDAHTMLYDDDYEGDEPSVAELLDNALEVIYSAPAFDWVDRNDFMYELDLADIEGCELVEAEIPFYIEEDEHTVSAVTVMSGAVHEFEFTKAPEGGLFCERMIQGGEQYQLYQDETPPSIRNELEERYGHIIE